MRLYYLDDDPDLLIQYRGWLPQIGNWEVVTESDPNQTLPHLKSETYDIYLIDFQLFSEDVPACTGLETADAVHQKLKENNSIPPTSPVVYVSGNILGKNFLPGEIWLPYYDRYLLCRVDDMKDLDRALKNIHAHHQRNLPPAARPSGKPSF